MAFQLFRTLALDDISEDWKGAYLTFREPSGSEAQKLAGLDASKTEAYSTTITLLSTLLVDGKGFNGKELIQVKPADIGELPLSIIGRAISFLLHQVQSATATPE